MFPYMLARFPSRTSQPPENIHMPHAYIHIYASVDVVHWVPCEVDLSRLDDTSYPSDTSAAAQ